MGDLDINHAEEEQMFMDAILQAVRSMDPNATIRGITMRGPDGKPIADPSDQPEECPTFWLLGSSEWADNMERLLAEYPEPWISSSGPAIPFITLKTEHDAQIGALQNRGDTNVNSKPGSQSESA
jgi:hypothetical protein